MSGRRSGTRPVCSARWNKNPARLSGVLLYLYLGLEYVEQVVVYYVDRVVVLAVATVGGVAIVLVVGIVVVLTGVCSG